MEITRRGIFGLLGGAILGKVIGPKLLAEPTPALWQAAKSLPVKPVVNTYVPMEYISGEVLRIVDQELKWLKLARFYDDGVEHRRIGDTTAAREPIRFDPFGPEPVFVGKRRLITLIDICRVDIDLSDIDAPFDHIEARRIKPAACSLAEQVIRLIRNRGGGEYLVSGKLAMIGDQCILAHNRKAGLGLRAIRHTDQGRNVLNLDMLLGVG